LIIDWSAVQVCEGPPLSFGKEQERPESDFASQAFCFSHDRIAKPKQVYVTRIKNPILNNLTLTQ
ncbi:hypothetical protein, partial [Vibrio neptunius]|uniref:hypothetical protein n=1 Tax=Vibrio neptunius TaxID=170651 RepID=UPI0030D7C989